MLHGRAIFLTAASRASTSDRSSPRSWPRATIRSIASIAWPISSISRVSWGPRATSRTKTIGNPSFAGAVGFIGHGTEAETGSLHCAECALAGNTRQHGHHGAAAGATSHGHADDHDHGGGAVSNERFDVELDLSANLRDVAADDDEVSLKLVAVDADGNEVSADEFRVDEIELAID